MMRIITGKARGVRLVSPEGDHTRPTAERTKEAVFSMLQFELADADVLDLFAGSGQLGLEAISRGARAAVFCDNSRQATEIVRRNAEKTHLLTQCEIVCLPHRACLERMKGKRQFRLVFLDPPYAAGLIPDTLRLLESEQLLADGAKIVCESAEPEDVFLSDSVLRQRFEVLRAVRYGAAFVTILAWKEENKK